MGSREELHAVLENILGSENVYFQPHRQLKCVTPQLYILVVT